MKSLQEIINSRVAFGAWCVPQGELTDPARCRRAAELGLDYVFADIGPGVAENMLDNCQAAGLRVMGFAEGVINLPADRASSLDRAIAPFKNHPAYAGTALRDEPGVYDYPRLKRLVDAHKEAAPGKIALINLYPMYASAEQLNGVDYQTYVERYAEEVDAEIISYDFYPLYGQKEAGTWLQDNYLRNFEIVARACKKHGSQMWYFIQTLAFNHILRDPGAADLRFQIFCALSFGTRVIQLFTYGTPANGDEYFEDALIDRAGNQTFRYEINKNVISEFNLWTGLYVGYRWAGAMTYGGAAAGGSHEYDVVFPGGIVHKHRLQGSYMELDHPLRGFDPVRRFSGDGPLLMGCFEKQGGCAFTLVNMLDPALGKAVRAKVELSGPAKLRISGKEGTREADCGGTLELMLEAGDGAFVEIL